MIARKIRHLFGVSLMAVLAAAVPARADAPSTLTTLFSFTGGSDGGDPVASLISDNTGALYGTTAAGGSAHKGTVFKLTPPSTAGGLWTETVLYSFRGFGSSLEDNDGEYPEAGLISDSTGALYGTTFAGGYDGYGTVFKLAPPSTPGGAWTESVLCSIRHSCGGSGYPHAGLTIDSSGALYGTTTSFESVSSIFKVTPPSTPGGSWTGSSVYHLNDYQGPGVYAGLIFDSSGALYGTDSEDIVIPSSCPPDIFVGCGIVFKLTPPSIPGGTWTESTLHTFNRSDGASPEASLISDSTGALYGTTSSGGNGSCNSGLGCGVVFKLTPPSTPGGTWTERVLHSFSGSDGAHPVAGLISDSTGALYGTTFSGGNASCNSGLGCGVVFKLTPPATPGGTWTERTLYSFSGSDGANPMAGLISDSAGVLYGTTSEGGVHDAGTVFKLVTFAGLQGRPNCIGKSISALAVKYGGLAAAAAALRYSGVQDLQDAVVRYCGG
jgi:uncharacterized repeat protein (TIGR03803 family)